MSVYLCHATPGFIHGEDARMYDLNMIIPGVIL
jgi:hypothetical protein